MQIEADGIITLCENVKTRTHAKMKFTLGTLHGKDVCVVVCGVGKVNAAMCALMLIEKYKPDIVLNSGVAGSLSPIVGIGDIVVATKSVEHDMNGTALGDKQGEITFPDGNMMFFECDKQASTLLAAICKEIPDTKVAQGIIASGDIFVSDRKQRFKINDRFGALACEMEGAAIGHVSPEAALGGNIALVEEGDIIAIDINAHSIELKVSDEVLAERRSKWTPREPKIKTGYLARYASLVTSANRGAVLEIK